MKSRLFLIMLLLLATIGGRAQQLPFGVGEVLFYEGKVSKIIQGLSVAEMSFTFLQSPDNRDNFLIKTEAKSKGTLTRVFGLRFLQQYESTVDGSGFKILRTVKRDEQGDRIRLSDTDFDYTNGQVMFVETNPNEPNKPPRKIVTAIKGEVHDLVSGIYALRKLPLENGQTYNVQVSDSGLVYNVPVRVIGRERQNSIVGKTMCIKVEPLLFGPGRFIEDKGSMFIWITDDARRLPVRSQIKANFGRVSAKLEIKLRKYAAGQTQAPTK